MTAPALARTSSRLAFAGTAAAHMGFLALVCLLSVSPATSLVLPPPVVRISLAAPAEEAVPAPAEAPLPEPVTAETPPEPPPPEPAAQEIPKDEVRPESVPVERPLPEKPRRRNAAPAAKAETPPPKAERTASEAQYSRVSEEERQSLLSALIAAMERAKRYPAAARRLGLEGRVIAVVQIDGQGRISGVRIRKEQAHAVLEKAALDTMLLVQRNWRPMPVREPMTLAIPVRYAITP
ncbi:MAG: TonB family protein [Desulfovibrio sp.]|jgi:protein TonB|nr:TonB family protein [Desulfovibrio sp.]